MKDLDIIFEALASKHRREIIYSLSLQPHSISQLAARQKLSLPAIHKHIKLLEKAKIVMRKKYKQTNFLALNKESLRGLQEWLAQYQAYWGTDKETLENYVMYLSDNKEKRGGENKK